MFSDGVLLTESQLELNRAAISQQLYKHEIDLTVPPCRNLDPEQEGQCSEFSGF